MGEFSNGEIELKKVVTDNQESDANTVIEEAIRKYGKQLTNFVFSYVKDWSTAEDVVQDSFIKAFRKYDSFKGDSSLKTWLYRIAANQSKDYLKSSYFKRVILSNIISTKNNREKSSEGETDDDLAYFVLKLPIKYREVIILHYYEELGVQQIANLLQMNESTIKTRLRRARTLLKDKLEGSEGYYE
ncbi:sigma-70 family RNA polymerase sigma factor [Pseudalkalibacillus decolorationis]|uniref:sigma-70 family RNA polymerase sigma factor n=1 Tax=Pseudalkalibacillus decolorationis TaxID=163879 RepID=UPI0021488FEA|nr:sigma-70 family RNA polymerase sigma factor [Pseudalkalibacillus decolorationis]